VTRILLLSIGSGVWCEFLTPRRKNSESICALAVRCSTFDAECFRASFRFPIDRALVNGMMAGRWWKKSRAAIAPLFCRPEFKTDSEQYL